MKCKIALQCLNENKKLNQIIDSMAGSSVYKIEQFNYEQTMWLRQLDFFKQENAWLKTRLAAALDGNTSKSVLPQAEYFQNQFICNDEQVENLKAQVNKLSAIKPQSTTTKNMAAMQHKLRIEMELFETTFINLKNAFSKFVTVAVQ